MWGGQPTARTKIACTSIPFLTATKQLDSLGDHINNRAPCQPMRGRQHAVSGSAGRRGGRSATGRRGHADGMPRASPADLGWDAGALGRCRGCRHVLPVQHHQGHVDGAKAPLPVLRPGRSSATSVAFSHTHTLSLSLPPAWWSLAIKVQAAELKSSWGFAAHHDY